MPSTLLGSHIRSLISIFLTTLSFKALGAKALTPIDTIETFFSWALVRHESVLPSPKERMQLAKWLAPELLTLLDIARFTQARCIRSTPKGDKPNLLEGDLFVGNEERATEAAYQRVMQFGGKTAVAVDMLTVDKRWPKAKGQRAVAWRVGAALVSIDGRWCLDDMRFPQDRSLRATLQSHNDDGARECIAP